MSEPHDQSAALELQRGHELAAPRTPDIGQMLQAAIDKGITQENVGVLEKMMDLFERDQKRKAEMEFSRAFGALQSEMPRIKAVKEVPDRDGNLKYKFAPYEEIMEQVRPFLLKHGFSISFSMTESEGRVTQTCKLRHAGGHSEVNSFSVRIGKGPPGASEAQADGAAGTYAKRHALCNALNIVVEQDTDASGTPDARMEGAFIPPDKVMYLRELLQETGTNEEQFLKTACAPAIDKITMGAYHVLVKLLIAKKDKRKDPAP